MFKYKRHISIDGLSLPEIASGVKSNKAAIESAMDALKNKRETITDLVTLSCYRYSKEGIEKFFMNPQINELFVESVNFLKTVAGT